MSVIAESLRKVRADIEQTARACGRDPGAITLVAVSKTFSEHAVRDAFTAGQRDFGENYAAEMVRKADALRAEELRWHFIGHLQSNKVKLVLGRTVLVHSLDRESLARELQKRADAADLVVDALVEVRTTDEATKTGVRPADVGPLMAVLRPLDRIRVRGMMTMGPFSDDPEDARPCFRRLRELLEQHRGSVRSPEMCSELSMGMTSDVHIGIQEGATIVRLGTAVFGPRTSTATRGQA